jgi:hypothetical protein
MSWFVWLGLAAFVTAVVAVIGMQGKGTRPVAHTSMMGMARFFPDGHHHLCIPRVSYASRWLTLFFFNESWNASARGQRDG